MNEGSKVRKVAFVGDYLPRKCGIATFTSDLLTAVAAAHPQSQCFAVSVNDLKSGYDYPDVVRFEIEGAGTIAGVGNADPVSVESYQLPQRKAWQGRCIVVVKSGKKSGNIILKATSTGLKSSELVIKAN